MSAIFFYAGKKRPRPIWGLPGPFFPQPLVDGFSKLWLRGKGNLRVETLIPAGSMMGFTLGLMLGLVLAAKSMQKQQYLQGFLRKSSKNTNIYKVFRKNTQTHQFTGFQQYLLVFLQKACNNNNIYTVVCKKRSNT